MSDVDTAPTGAEVAPVENTADTPEQTQASTESATEQDTEQQDKPRDEKGRFVPQERVNEITRARREAERERDYWRQQAEIRQHAAPSQPAAQSNDKPPSLEDYNFDHSAWAQAMTQHAIAQAEQRVEARFQQQSQRQHQQTIEQQFEQRSQEYAKAHPDYEQSVSELSRAVQFHPAVVEAIGLSDKGPELVHHLAQHLDEADRIARMPPHIAAVQLGRIEAQLSAPKAKPVTNAPNPPPVLGGGKATVNKSPDEMTQAEWLAWRNSQLKK